MSKLVGAHAMVFARGSRTTRAHALYMISSHVPKFPYRLAMLPITMRPCAIRVSTFPVPSFLFDRGRGFEIDSRGRAAGSGTRRFRSPKSAPPFPKSRRTLLFWLFLSSPPACVSFRKSCVAVFRRRVNKQRSPSWRVLSPPSCSDCSATMCSV